MAEELQSLLEKINQEGVAKAEARSAEIIAAAQKDAEAIVAAARREAEALTAKAAADSQAAAARTRDALRQAGRDIMLQLRGELTSRLDAAVGEAAAAALTPEFMAGVIKELAAAFAAAPDGEIRVRTAVRDTAALDAALRAALADSFRAEPRVFPGSGIAAGLEVSFDGGKCFYDFTLDAVADLMGTYTGEKIGDLFKAEK